MNKDGGSSNHIIKGLNGNAGPGNNEATPLISKEAPPIEAKAESTHCADTAVMTLCCATVFGLGGGLPAGLISKTLAHTAVSATFFSCFGGCLGYSVSDDFCSPRPR